MNESIATVTTAGTDDGTRTRFLKRIPKLAQPAFITTRKISFAMKNTSVEAYPITFGQPAERTPHQARVEGTCRCHDTNRVARAKSLWNDHVCGPSMNLGVRGVVVVQEFYRIQFDSLHVISPNCLMATMLEISFLVVRSVVSNHGGWVLLFRPCHGSHAIG